MLGNERSKTGFDAAAELPRKKAEKLGGSTQNNRDNEVCEAHADAITNVINVVCHELSNEKKCASESAGTPQKFAETRQDKQPGLRLQQVRHPPLGHWLGGVVVSHGEESGEQIASVASSVFNE